jgi:GT2 family glycosyltransferase
MIKNLKQLAIVVLFWNDSKKTIKCLKSLFNQKNKKFDIVLVDNNSEEIYSKKILNWLKKNKINFIKIKKNFIFKQNNTIKLFYIKNITNYGCGLGHNSGYKF